MNNNSFPPKVKYDKQMNYPLEYKYAMERKCFLKNIHYDLKIDITEYEQEIQRGNILISFEIDFDNYSIDKLQLEFAGNEINQIKINNQIYLDHIEWINDSIIIPLNLLENNHNEIEIEYCNKQSDDNNGFLLIQDKEAMEQIAQTNFEPFFCHLFMPCFDQTSLPALFHLSIIHPCNWHVLGNSTIKNQLIINEKQKITNFNVANNMLTYLISIVAGNINGVQLQIDKLELGIQSKNLLFDPIHFNDILDMIRSAIIYFEDKFRIDFPFDKLYIAYVPNFPDVGMENTGLITITEKYLLRKDHYSKLQMKKTIIHEIAHHYFGNYLFLDWWNDLWLNESFATFYEYKCAQVILEQEQNVWFDFMDLKNKALKQDSQKHTHPVIFECKNTDDCESRFNLITQNKGGSILQQLNNMIGEELFDRIVSEQLNDHSFSNVNSNNFQQQLTKYNVDEEYQFTNLLKSQGLIELKSHLKLKNGICNSFRIEQKSKNELRTFQLRIKVFFTNGNFKIYNIKILDKKYSTVQCLIDEKFLGYIINYQNTMQLDQQISVFEIEFIIKHQNLVQDEYIDLYAYDNAILKMIKKIHQIDIAFEQQMKRIKYEKTLNYIISPLYCIRMIFNWHLSDWEDGIDWKNNKCDELIKLISSKLNSYYQQNGSLKNLLRQIHLIFK